MTDRYCCDCDNVVEQTRREPQYRWLCRAYPREAVPAFTSPGALYSAPFYRCMDMNATGVCPEFTPKRHWLDVDIKETGDARQLP